jgi:cell wall-associated NlpC family hydrolase
MRTSTVAVGVMFGGGVLAYSAIKGYGVSAVLRNLISGKDPTQASQATPIDFPSTTSGQVKGASFSSSSIVDTAMRYVGTPYRWAGYTPDGGWDCSGFVNYVVGKMLGYPIPGVKNFQATWHGPITAAWYVWTGATTIPREMAQPGDLAVWPTHMGIIVDAGQHMVNAYSTGFPTEVTTVDGIAPRGEVLRVRRLNTGGGVLV